MSEPTTTSDANDALPLDDAARALGATAATVRTWTLNGRIRGAIQPGPRAPWLVPWAEVLRLLEERAEREEREKQRPATWQPMTERSPFAGRARGDSGERAP